MKTKRMPFEKTLLLKGSFSETSWAKAWSWSAKGTFSPKTTSANSNRNANSSVQGSAALYMPFLNRGEVVLS